MKNPHPDIFALQSKTVEFARVDRNHYLPGTERHENDAEHTLSVIYLSWYVYQETNPSLELEKILKYAAGHDFVEVYAGDVNAFASDAEREAKIINEANALTILKYEFGPTFPDFIDTIEGYEKRIDEEAVFVWTIDKMQALIMGGLDNWRTYVELEITYDEFCHYYKKVLGLASPYCVDLLKDIFEYSKSTYPK
jgi:putative hydrolases of HD superfamily